MENHIPTNKKTRIKFDMEQKWKENYRRTNLKGTRKMEVFN